MVGLNLLAAWALLQMNAGRPPSADVHTLAVEMVASPAPAPAPVPPPPPAAPRPQPAARPQLLSAQRPAATAEFTAPPLEAPVHAPVIVTEPAERPAPPAPAAPPPMPRTISISDVQYLTPPVLEYPFASKRAREQGVVHVRMLVDAQGRPQQLSVARSSGFARLDESAMATARATRFKPHTENGVPQPFWIVMPLVFELEN